MSASATATPGPTGWCWRRSRRSVPELVPSEDVLWNNIEARLEHRLPKWRNRADEMRQLAAVEERFAGRSWSDDKVFEALLMAVLSANTDWSKIEGVQAELSELFSEIA